MTMNTLPRLIPPDMDAELEVNISRVPEHCRDGLLNYLRYGIPPGDFLQAVLANDLSEACGRADSVNRSRLFDYCFVLHNYAPSEAWGSRVKVLTWIERGRLSRQKAEEAQP